MAVSRSPSSPARGSRSSWSSRDRACASSSWRSSRRALAGRAASAPRVWGPGRSDRAADSRLGAPALGRGHPALPARQARTRRLAARAAACTRARS
jgi:hypothetical protein